jgi:hypothetical protein
MNEQHKHMPTNPPATDGRPAPAPSEAQFLQAQADQAAAALSGAFAALKADLAKGADPRAWAHQYPWAAVGAAAVAGFAAASAFVPSKEEQALKKLERIERALRPDYSSPEHGAAQRAAAPDSKPKSLTGRLVSELFSALKPALSSALAAYAASPGNDGDAHNGHNPATGAAAGNAAYYQQEEDPNA